MNFTVKEKETRQKQLYTIQKTNSVAFSFSIIPSQLELSLLNFNTANHFHYRRQERISVEVLHKS